MNTYSTSSFTLAAMIFSNTLGSDLPTEALNTSFPEGCIQIRVSQRDFLPWNNPDNVVSRQVVEFTSKMRSVLSLLLFLIGGPANVINMAVFVKQGVKDRVNVLLFSLSLADEVYLIIAFLNNLDELMLLFQGQLTRIGPINTFLVNNHLLGFFGFGSVSFVLSAILACERCYCVLRPLKYQTLLRSRTVAIIIGALHGVILAPVFIIAVRYYVVCVFDPETGLVSKGYSHREFYRQHKTLIDYTDSILFGAGLPTFMMIVVTAATAVTIWKIRQIVAWRAESTTSVSAKEMALTKMLIGTSVLLIVCATPGCMFRVTCLFLPEMNTGGRNQNLYLVGLRVANMFLYVNCSLNIFVYYVMGSRYRETFWAMFGRQRQGVGRKKSEIS